jgi:aromatic ring hydroxylase
MIAWYRNRWSTVHLSRRMNRYLKVDQSAEQLRRRTEAFRKLATMVVDGAVLKALKDLAAKLEARARAVEKSLSDETNRPEG